MQDGYSYLGRMGPAIRMSPTDLVEQRARQEAAAGDAHFAAGQIIAARQRYSEASRLQPDEGRYIYLIGICDWRLGHTEEAGRNLQTAVQVSPNFAFGQSMLSEWYLVNGMVEPALEASEK